MDRTSAIGGFLVIAVLAVGLVGAFLTGVGPAPGGSDSGGTITDFPTATPMDESSPSTESAPTAATETSPFGFTIDRVEPCGQTCREVTAALSNNQNEIATNVTVYSRIFAGRNNTDSDDLVWEGKEEVGTLEPAESRTTTERIELTIQEGLMIEQNDGWITIVTTIQTDDTTVTFRDSQQVA